MQKSFGKQIVQALNQLLIILNDVASQPLVLDHKLADYVFFPLHYLFRQSKALPFQAIKLALECLSLIISNDWCRNGGPDFTKQLLILLTFLAGGDPADTTGQTANEDVSETALQCLTKVLHQSSDISCISVRRISDEDVPLVGQLVTVALDALRKGSSSRVRLSAIGVLRRLVLTVEDISVLRRFLPGIVSKIAKLLQPGVGSSTPYRVQESCLQTLSYLLQKTMVLTGPIQGEDHLGEGPQSLVQEVAPPDKAWIEATAAQVKLALANVVHLQYHQKSEVIEALFSLCRVILQDCQESLAGAELLILEVLLIICSRKEFTQQDERLSLVHAMVVRESRLVEVLRLKIHDWILTLPRVIQSNDSLKHSRLISQLSIAYQMISPLDNSMDLIDMEVSSGLQDSVKAAIQAWQPAHIESIPMENDTFTNIIHSDREFITSYSFAPISFVGSSQKEAIESLGSFVQALESSRASRSLRKTLIGSLRSASSTDQLACLWLCSKLLNVDLIKSNQIDLFFSYPDDNYVTDDGFSEAVYSSCLNVLSSSALENDTDWRVQGLAIEIITFRAYQEKQEFRAELVDALYPIVERLGSNNSLLREHAIASLNIISKACGYAGSSDIIIQNVDYLLNSIALKFNTFDISPQTPTVLQMMIQLCGSALIPYLDDLIESIFSTLSSFHGYSKLVESLFAVLSTVVNEGQKVNLPAIKASKDAHYRNKHEPPISIPELAKFLKDRRQRETLADEPESRTILDIHTVIKDSSKEQGTNDQGLEASASRNSINSLEETSQPPTKTYTTIQSIVRIGQYYFTHESPTLRHRLLELTRKGCVALSQNENEFLPLLNDIWPVVMKRLYDSEPYVCIEACKTLSEIFHCAGDFVSSRVDNEWPEIRSLYRSVHEKKVAEKGGRGRFTSSYHIWEGLVELCCSIIDYVNISAEMENDLMDILGPYMKTRTNVLDTLDRMNPDAVWLALERERQRGPGAIPLIPPQVEGFNFARFIV